MNNENRTTLTKKKLDWSNLGFVYRKTDFRFTAYHDGQAWSAGELTTKHTMEIEEGATSLHYAQQCFEGMKSYQFKDGSIHLFRPADNAARMAETGQRLSMPVVPEELFIRGVEETVRANYAWIPPHGYNASLYIRPLLIGVGDNIGIKKAPKYIFRVFCMPVGPYYKSDKLPAISMAVTDYDRAAPQGIGNFKAGSNYAGGINSAEKAKQLGADEVIYLDSKERKYLDEAGSANILVKTKYGEFCTPKSASILPSITRRSAMTLAEKELGLKTSEREIGFPSEATDIEEMAACGTAAVISPIGKILFNGTWYRFYNNGDTPGPVMEKIYQLLTGIQFGDLPDRYGWMHRVRI